MAIMKNKVRAWGKKASRAHDTARAGVRPYDETVRRHLLAELEITEGK